MTTFRDRIKKWFKNRYEEEQFELSMGNQRVDAAGMKTLVAFLAQGVAETGCHDPRYRVTLVETHMKLRAMIEDLQKIPGHEQSCAFHYPLILGILIEEALHAVLEMHKEDS